MPRCSRCGRVQATCEMRRTTAGFVCKDNKPGSRCWKLTADVRLLAKAAR